MFSLPHDVLIIILQEATIKDACHVSLTNKEHNALIKKEYKGSNEVISCSLKRWNTTFPNARYLNIRNKKNITGSDFKYLSMVEILNMSLCEQQSVTDHSFRSLSNLKDLNLQGACGHWIGGHHFTDALFDSLKDLEKFYIDNNHVITNRGIKKLVNIRDLTVHNCSNITDGISALITLKKLSIYNLRMTDDMFKPLINIEELSMTFIDVTEVAISYLTNIKKFKNLSCKNIKYTNFDKLRHLINVDITHCKIQCLTSLSNIKKVSLYGCSVHNNDITYLTDAKGMIMKKCPVYRHLTIYNESVQMSLCQCNYSI